MKYIWKIFLVAVALVTAIPSFAVTDKEMEQARALAAKHYLRYANNGSDYLDKLNPQSVSELSKSLKAKEQENIKAFNAVAVPKDYASWDKNKLVEYWSSTFFKAPGLKEDGKKCLSVLAKNLNKISVSSPQSESKPAETATETKPEVAKPAETTTSDAKLGDSGLSVAVASTSVDKQEGAAEDAVVAAVAQAEADAGLADDQPKTSSNTGWYIGILVVLVGVVIWLVVYASKSMKETGATLADHKSGDKEIREAKRLAKEELAKMREQYVASLTSKNEEIKQLKAKCDAIEVELETTRRKADKATGELETALKELTALRQTGTVQSPKRTLQEQRPVATPTKSQPQGNPQAVARPGGLPPVVFLSYVNQKGLFTKASRTLNAESSVYRMDIPDGRHGKFKVVSDAEILERLLENPEHWLGGGCVIENPEDTDIAAEIVTLQNGEAIFADNTCKVTKKARIKFI